MIDFTLNLGSKYLGSGYIREKSHDLISNVFPFYIKMLMFKQFCCRYAVKALGRLNLDPDINEAQLDRALQRLSDWNHVVAFYTLRLVLAPVIETFILLDRVLYLHEQGGLTRLVDYFFFNNFFNCDNLAS